MYFVVIIPVIAPWNIVIYGSTSYRQGSMLELICSSMGDLPLQYTWTRVTNGVNNAFPASIITTNNILRISSVSVSDGGNYTCTVTNDVGSSSSTIPVYSKYKHLIVHKITLIYVCMYVCMYVCSKAKKKQTVRNERVSYLHVALL